VGELATEYGLTGWGAGMAIDTALTCFAQWRNYRGAGNTEQWQILDFVNAYVETFGDTRFTDTTDTTRLHGIRSGYYLTTDNGKEWLFTKSGLQEATKGHDFKQVLAVLKNKVVAKFVVIADNFYHDRRKNNLPMSVL
jgi:putative DNA primase/helicase